MLQVVLTYLHYQPCTSDASLHDDDDGDDDDEHVDGHNYDNIDIKVRFYSQ